MITFQNLKLIISIQKYKEMFKKYIINNLSYSRGTVFENNILLSNFDYLINVFFLTIWFL